MPDNKIDLDRYHKLKILEEGIKFHLDNMINDLFPKLINKPLAGDKEENENGSHLGSHIEKNREKDNISISYILILIEEDNNKEESEYHVASNVHDREYFDEILENTQNIYPKV